MASVLVCGLAVPTVQAGGGIQCPAQALTSCVEPRKGSMDFNHIGGFGRAKFRLSLKRLEARLGAADFGDPIGGDTTVAMCFYDDNGNIVLDEFGLPDEAEYIIDRAGEICTTGKPCWRKGGLKGFRYIDVRDISADGIRIFGAFGGAEGKGIIKAVGLNKADRGFIHLPAYPNGIRGNSSPTAQIIFSDGICASATMNFVKADTASRYLALKR